MVIVHRKVNFIGYIGGVRLLPGMNSISDAEYEQMRTHRRGNGVCTFDEEIQCGNIVVGGTYASNNSDAVVTKDFKAHGAKIAEEIASMSFNEAKEVIAKLQDATVLKQLIAIDARLGINELATSRIDDIVKQKDIDTKPITKEAPSGDGSDLFDQVDDVSGTQIKTAIPALKRGRK